MTECPHCGQERESNPPLQRWQNQCTDEALMKRFARIRAASISEKDDIMKPEIETRTVTIEIPCHTNLK